MKGLSPIQVEESRQKNGPNTLTPPAKTPLRKQYLDKFNSPIIRILLIALGLSFLPAAYLWATGQEGGEALFEPFGILIAILLVTGLSFYFERRAAGKFDILNRVNDDVPVKTVRDGSVHEVPRRDIVVGDIVMLDPGNEIPADGDLIHSVDLRVNESTLTGEFEVNKTHDAEIADRVHASANAPAYPCNRVYRGSIVMEGSGIMRVDAVGDRTEYGHVYQGAQIDNNLETPLHAQLRLLSKTMTFIGYAVAALVFMGRLTVMTVNGVWLQDWLSVGSYLLNTFMMAVTVIVVTVPEGLPMSVPLALAYNMRRMLESHNLVRKMQACETMGACTVICTDKTGTLTHNRMQVHSVHFLIMGRTSYDGNHRLLDNGLQSRLIKEAISANTTAFLDETDIVKPQIVGNHTEGALLLWLRSQGENYETIRRNARVIEQLPFSTDRKYMATAVDSFLIRNKRMLYVKGAPEIILSYCRSVYVGGKEEDKQPWIERIEAKILEYQNRAMRTLGFAVTELDPDREESCFENGRLRRDLPLKFIGFVAISDPVRADIPEAIQQCFNAGIAVKMLTGDNSVTATEIARQTGLWNDEEDGPENRITGPELSTLSDEELESRADRLKIISRARPRDKERLVKTLQKKGHIVAVTGDGTNDAPALAAAQVGLSMGDGTSVAKESSAITILDNAFSSIVSAVLWGRSLYQNVQRFILFQLTVNVIACIVIVFGSFLGETLPLTVTQMLWVNLVMDTFAAIALFSLPPNPEVMKDAPRDIKQHIITPAMRGCIIGMGCTLFLVLFGLMQYFKYEDTRCLLDFDFGAYARDFFRFDALPPGAQGITKIEQAIFFSFFVMLQVWNLFNARAFHTRHTAFHQLFRTADGFLPVVVLIVLGQILIVNVGSRLFDVEPLGWHNWLIIILAPSVVLWAGEIIRFLINSRAKIKQR